MNILSYKFVIILFIVLLSLILACKMYRWKNDKYIGSGENETFDISKCASYPYLHLSHTINEMKDLFEQFVKSDLDETIDDNNNLGLLKLSEERSDRYKISKKFIAGNKWEILVDYFQEPVRSKCNRRGKLSPDEMFHTPEISIKWSKKFKNKVKNNTNITPKLYGEMAQAMRKTIWNDCDLMSAGVVKSILDEFKPKSILMCLGGWGDAIIATMAYEYYTEDFEHLTAVDVNAEAVENWQLMLETYAKDPTKYTFLINPFETVVLPDMMYDLVYASPPYAWSEEYTESDDQSWVKYKGIDNWFAGFLRPVFEKAWSYLRPGGHLVVIVNDVIIDGEEINFVDRFHEVIDNLDSRYYSTWGFKKYPQQKTYQPIFIWKKL